MGTLITIEGIEGSGKSTQITRLAERLKHMGVDVAVTKEPGGTVLGREIRTLLLVPHASGERWCPRAELMLFYADRAQHVEHMIRPAMDAGQVVIVDRFEDSTRAYQGASGVNEETLQRMKDVVLGTFKPDLTILLDMDPDVAMGRVTARNAATHGFAETRFDDAGLEFHHKVRTRFLAIAEREPDRVKRVDADAEPGAVADAIWGHVSAVLERTYFRQ